ncbi:MAG TPA: type III pantothenate kinase [Candidatus Baltobacteraceae bacterium]|jgi:type III pantothenate kinase|nr:type III pantothenate kinase [Candidatus Baltobacteraceae bacterium]
MLLAIDVGNTETKLGCFEPGTDVPVQSWRVTTELRRTADEYGVFFTQLFATARMSVSAIDAVVIASVVPKLDPVLTSVCSRFFGVAPVFLEPQHQTLMAVRTDRPAEVGADLLAAAIGGREKYGAPLIVVSYGTATAFMAISAEGEYLGVAIAPGISISIDALIGRTAKLPQIALEAPQYAIGRTTIESLQAGIVYGFVGQTEALIRHMRAELGAEARVVATGGLADIIAKHSALIDEVDSILGLTGLRLFHTAQSRRAPTPSP